MRWPRQVSRPRRGVALKLANIETGEIWLVLKLSDIWCRNSRTKPLLRPAGAAPAPTASDVPGAQQPGAAGQRGTDTGADQPQRGPGAQAV